MGGESIKSLESALHCDVVVVGAGIVGSTVACALAQSALKVAIIEPRPLPQSWPEQREEVDGFDARVSALTIASQQWLEQLLVWDAIAERRVCGYRHMRVWDAEGTGNIAFNADDVGRSVLGHIVENRLVATALAQRLQQQSEANRLQIFSPDTLQGMESHSDNSHTLQLSSGKSITTSLVVAADGANSPVRELNGFSIREWDYGHHAIATTVRTELPHQHTAWQRFMPEGPLAFLPLGSESSEDPGSYCSIVWSAIPEYADQLMALSDKQFADALAKAFEYRLGEIEQLGKRFSFPLRQRHAIHYVQPGIALVGDAAHTIHPLAGQGLNLGLMDAQVLAEELLRAERRELAVGSMPVLKRYQRRRKAANLAMMAGMEGFKRLFENSQLPVRWVRNAGMSWVSEMAPLKQRVMRQAMGI